MRTEGPYQHGEKTNEDQLNSFALSQEFQRI